MSNVSSTSTPREIDEHIASLYTEMARLDREVESDRGMIFNIAGIRREYRGRNLVFTASFDEAREKAEQIATGDDYRAHDAQRRLAEYDASIAAAQAKAAEILEAEKLYRGWSRFFVVTSSDGHIHSSMHCSSCYATTTFGWLPQLSGKDEADAVETCGPALCSVCFPSAPVENQGGKISSDDAKRLANGATIAELKAEREAAKQAKADAKAEKARKAAERARKLMAKVEKFYAEHDGFDAVMARPMYTHGGPVTGVYELVSDLQQTVQDVVTDDHREFHGERRYGKNPRGVIAAAEELAA